MRLLFIFIILLFSIFSCSEVKRNQTLDANHHNIELDNGVLLYEKTPFSGIITRSYENGQPKSEIEYNNGRKHGVEKQWYMNGNIATIRSYENGIKVGIHEGWWENASQKFLYHFNEKGEYNGEVKEWYFSGVPYKHFNFSNGKEVGNQKLWNKNGKIKANYDVRNGERFGLIGLKKCFTVTTDTNGIK